MFVINTNTSTVAARWTIQTYYVIAWNLLSTNEILESRYVSERHITSYLWTVKYAFKRCNLTKLWADILLKFRWQIERASLGFRLGPGFTSTSPLRDTRRQKKKENGINKRVEKKMVEESKIETRNCLLFFDALSMRKNKTLNSDKNKNILLAETKQHSILLYKCYFWSLKW